MLPAAASTRFTALAYLCEPLALLSVRSMRFKRGLLRDALELISTALHILAKTLRVQLGFAGLPQGGIQPTLNVVPV